jgi:2-methylcitrate dehydratase PrpD
MSAVPEAPRARGTTEALGAWIAGTRLEDLPADVVAHAKLCILDSLGCGLYGAKQPWGEISAEVGRALAGSGHATLWGRDTPTGPAEAAMANGTATHGFEIDDIHVASLYHPGAVTVPAALAVAEDRAASGATLLTAIAAGYEIGIRLGMCAGIPHKMRGYHMTATVGCIGASAAVASLLGLDATGATDALGIGATQSGGLYAARMGAMAKRLHAGRAAQAGVLAGCLAERSFTGIRDALEAPFGGFMSTMADGGDLGGMTDGLGAHWELLAVGFKPYAACASTHTTIDALDALMADGLRPDNLETLTVHMSKAGTTNVGWPYKPNGLIAAQMNGFYTAAVKLLDGDAFIDQYREDRIADPAILKLIEKIDILHDPALDEGGPAKRHAVRVEARQTDGNVMSTFVEQRRGSVHHPLSRDEILTKFRRTAGAALPEDAVGALAEQVLGDLETMADVRSLGLLMTGA